MKREPSHKIHSEHIKKVLRVPPTLSDAKKKQDRMESCSKYVAKFQHINTSAVENPLTSALVREVHASNCAIAFEMHIGCHLGTFDLKFLQCWYSLSKNWRLWAT